MAGATIEQNKKIVDNSIANIFKTMEYGPATEDEKVALVNFLLHLLSLYNTLVYIN